MLRFRAVLRRSQDMIYQRFLSMSTGMETRHCTVGRTKSYANKKTLEEVDYCVLISE